MMRKLLEIVAVLALLNLTGLQVLADGPALSAQPLIQPDPNGSTAGGSASATPGSVGPATVASSEPITASSSNTAAPNSHSSQGSTSATAPGTSATVPTTGSASQPNASAPDGSAPSTTTSGPSANADASRSSVSTSDSRVRANAITTATGSFAGGVDGFGSAEDPTNASTCSTAEVTPGVPTDASLGTSCGTQPSSASEDFGANGSAGNGAAGGPSGSACLMADASAGTNPTTGLDTPCAAQSNASPSAMSGTSGASANAPTTTDSRAANVRESGHVLGLDSLPSTATAAASIPFLGAALVLAGVVILRTNRRRM